MLRLHRLADAVFWQYRFKEVLLLDCDVVPMRDPTYLFDSPEFRQQGNYFWGDIYGEGMFKDESLDYIGK